MKLIIVLLGMILGGSIQKVMMGEGLGAGYNINVPWESGGVGDRLFCSLGPHINSFDPNMIIISAGFDAG